MMEWILFGVAVIVLGVSVVWYRAAYHPEDNDGDT